MTPTLKQQRERVACEILDVHPTCQTPRFRELCRELRELQRRAILAALEGAPGPWPWVDRMLDAEDERCGGGE